MEISKWLVNINQQITTLHINSNRIETITDDCLNSFPNLRAFDASYNQITSPITSSTFQNLNKLEHIRLSSNQLECCDDAFENNLNLNSIYIDGNFFTSLPRLPKNLTWLHAYNQNGRWRELVDFQFDVSSSGRLTIDIGTNRNLSKIGNRVFCSAEVNQAGLTVIRDFYVDYEVAARFEKCLWRQFGLRNKQSLSNVFVNGLGGEDVCNCENYKLLQVYGISLKGSCSFLSEPVCGNYTLTNSLDDICKFENDFECDVDSCKYIIVEFIW